MNKCIDCNKIISRGSKQGRCNSCATKFKFSIPGYKEKVVKKGKDNANYKDGRSLKTYYCIDCSKEISKYSGIYGQSRCQNCNEKIKMIGKKHWNYMPELDRVYPLKFKSIKKIIRIRDNYICQNLECNHILEKECRQLDVHHIDYNKYNLKLSNLITLCRSCHMKTITNRDYWYAYYSYIRENC